MGTPPLETGRPASGISSTNPREARVSAGRPPVLTPELEVSLSGLDVLGLLHSSLPATHRVLEERAPEQ